MQKTSSDRVQEVQALLERGMSVRQTARELSVAPSTVQLIKKDLRSADAENEDPTKDIITHLTQTEKRLIGISLNGSMIFDDTAEGWTFTATDDQLRHAGSSLWFVGIVYPESAPEGWIDALDRIGVEWALSPLHDHDWWLHDSPESDGVKDGKPYHWAAGELYKKGDKKKPHWHIIIKFEKLTSLREANELIRPITHGTILQKCFSLKATFAYLTHMGEDPDKKYPYWKYGDEAERHNGFTIEPNAREKKELQRAIVEQIKQEGWTSFIELIDYYISDVEMLNIIMSHPAGFKAIVTAQYYAQFPMYKPNDKESMKMVQKELSKLNETLNTITKEHNNE